jgi:uncharacterized protein (UPF0332 family)
MKEASFGDCLSLKKAIRITPDIEKAKSLREVAVERIKASSRELTEQNANFVFEDYYSSILELVHCLTLIDGYNISNHICLGYYLRDVLKRDELFRAYDDLRYKRNSLTYYGKKMDFETAKSAITRSKTLFRELQALIKLP